MTVSDRNHAEIAAVARRDVDAQNYWVGKMRRRFTAHCCRLDAVGWDQGCCGGQWEETVDVGSRVIGFRPVKVQLLLDRRFVSQRHVAAIDAEVLPEMGGCAGRK